MFFSSLSARQEAWPQGELHRTLLMLCYKKRLSGTTWMPAGRRWATLFSSKLKVKKGQVPAVLFLHF